MYKMPTIRQYNTHVISHQLHSLTDTIDCISLSFKFYAGSQGIKNHSIQLSLSKKEKKSRKITSLTNNRVRQARNIIVNHSLYLDRRLCLRYGRRVYVLQLQYTTRRIHHLTRDRILHRRRPGPDRSQRQLAASVSVGSVTTRK